LVARRKAHVVVVLHAPLPRHFVHRVALFFIRSFSANRRTKFEKPPLRFFLPVAFATSGKVPLAFATTLWLPSFLGKLNGLPRLLTRTHNLSFFL